MKRGLPLIFNLRRDPFERADVNSNTYFDWMVDHVPQLYLMQATVAAQIENFIKFPPRQKPASLNLDAVLAMVSSHGGHAEHLRKQRALIPILRVNKSHSSIPRQIIRE